MATSTSDRQDGITPKRSVLVLAHTDRERALAEDEFDRGTGEWTVAVQCLPEDPGAAAIAVEQTLFDTKFGLVLFVGSAVAADEADAGGVVLAERISVLERAASPRVMKRKRTRSAGRDLIGHVRRTLTGDRRQRRRGPGAYDGPLLFGLVAMESEAPAPPAQDAAAWRRAFPEAMALDANGWDFAFGYYDDEELPALAILGLVTEHADDDEGACARAVAVAADLLAGVSPSGLGADALDATAEEGERMHLRADAEILPHESTQPIVQRPFAGSSRAQSARPRGSPHTVKPQVGPALVHAYIDDGGVPPPDLHLTIRRRGNSLEFTLNSERSDLPYNMQAVGETVLGEEFGGTPQAYRDSMKAQVLQIARRPERSDVQQLRNLGAKLYNDLFPDELKRAYADFREKDVRTLQITSDEPWIPWEMVRPHGPDFPADEFLCTRYAMTRWLAGGNPKQLFEIGAIASLEAGVVEGQDLLPTAKEECDHIAGLAARRHVENVTPGCAMYEVVEALLSRRDRDIHLWHVAAHGHLGDSDPDESVVVFKDRKWRANDLAGEHGYAIQRARPLVFFNACLVGQQDYSLARLAGWPAAWVQQNHCGGFLAPQWSVSSKLATAFSKAFYEAVIGDEDADVPPRTLGEAARLARIAVRDENEVDPAWLSYVVYGHPNARVHFGARTSAVA